MPAQTVTSHVHSNVLRRALQANGVFSGISGIAITVGSGFVAELLGLETTSAINLIGTSLFVFALWLFFITANESISYWLALAVVLLDLVWAAASALVVLTDWLLLTPAGKWLIVSIAAIVTAFALVQSYGLGQLRVTARALDTA